MMTSLFRLLLLSIQRCSIMIVVMMMLSTIPLTSSMRSVSLLSLPTHSPTIPIPSHSPTTSPTTCAMPTQQYDALYALYTSTNGTGWNKKCNNWIFSSTNSDNSAPCNGWYGVSCNSQCNVTELNLPLCQLTGTIPSQLGSMTSMIYLYLNSNSLTGTIPSQLGSMTSMTGLYLYSNSLTGTIPSQLGSITSMKYLYLYSNSLTGTIPSELGNLNTLVWLYLQGNNLQGSVPTSILTLPKLNSINLSGNQLLGGNITSLFSSNTSKSLRYVIMSSMSLTGSLPSSLFILPELNTLVLSSNCITGTISSSICESKNLYSLILDGVGVGSSCSSRVLRSPFHGYIPSCLFSMPFLSTLHLAGNGLIGTLPELSVNSNLTTLSLTSNRLTGICLSNHASIYHSSLMQL